MHHVTDKSLANRETDIAIDVRFERAGELLKVLGHPARLRILDALGGAEHCVHELVDRLALPQPTVSQHLQLLRRARLVTAQRDGREQRYRLVDHHVAHIVDDALAHVSEPTRSDTHHRRTR
jgi:DNA-binding transcriptional ArsR family regulator